MLHYSTSLSGVKCICLSSFHFYQGNQSSFEVNSVVLGFPHAPSAWRNVLLSLALEITVDFNRAPQTAQQPSPPLDRDQSEHKSFLDVHITDNLIWAVHPPTPECTIVSEGLLSTAALGRKLELSKSVRPLFHTAQWDNGERVSSALSLPLSTVSSSPSVWEIYFFLQLLMHKKCHLWYNV